MMTEHYLLSRHVMRGGLKSLNMVRISSRQCPEDYKFEALYNEEVQYLENQMVDSHPN
ncbi:hypothetical protein MTR67_039365 [Solanum verrucosum]|uniref:Uncharacterized protein n=1 Tax=Solanum verrucosum TaxID=315347 RepID=A0AAF0ZQL7_SOLVR|nr:hypothetical protein MTR67_039365 [Solanum verrucosum]